MKNFVKAMDRECSGFAFIQKFPRISMEKFKTDIFDSSHIREPMKDPMFDETPSKTELSAKQSLVFPRNHRSVEYEKEIEELLNSFGHKCQSSCMHFLKSHLNCFPKNCGDLNEELGEHFHQDIRIMEERYLGWWDVNLLTDYCRCLKWDAVAAEHEEAP